MTQRNIHKISAYRNSNKDDGSWFAYLQKMLDEVALEDDGVQVTICNVPRPLLESKPEVFLPQLIAIGPYHHWRPELYDMEKYKLSAVKRIQRKSPHLKFKDLVDSILVHECRIRENYHKNLDFHRDTLGGLMAIDTCFLLEFLEVYLDDENGSAQTKSFGRISSRMMHLVDNTGQKSGHNIILRDIIMLENQIPLFLLLKILNWEHQTSNNEQFLIKILGGLIKELCPLKTTENIPIDIRLTKHAHLLALLYHSLLPCRIETSVAISERTESEIKEVPVEAPISDRDDGIKFKGETTHATQLCNKVWSILAVSGLRAVKPLLVIMRIPWKIVAIIPGVSLLIKPFGFLFPGGDVTPEQLIDGNAITDDKFIVFGVGSMQLINALVHALSSETSSPASVVASVPYYGSYKSQTLMFDSKSYDWEGDAWDLRNTVPTNSVIEFVTSPNNPDGQLNKPVLNGSLVIYDHAYYWPHYTSIQAPADGDAMLFTISKLSGHAGSRFGWALIRNSSVYEKVLEYVGYNSMGTSHESNLRMLTIIKAMLAQKREEEDNIFRFAKKIMSERWKRLNDIVSSTKRFSLQSLSPLSCTYFNATMDPSPAYGWLKCEMEEDEDCYAVLNEGGIISRPGSRFGASERYTRLSLLKTDDDFQMLLWRLSNLVLEEGMDEK